MDWFGLLDRFGINTEHPEKLQTGAKTGAYTIIYETLLPEIGKTGDDAFQDECCQKVCSKIYDLMQGIYKGSMLKRTAAAAGFTANIKKSSVLRTPHITEISFDRMIRLASGMHLHTLSDKDFLILSDEAAHLLLDQGPLAQIAENRMICDETNLKVITSAGADRLYTAFVYSLQNRSSLEKAYLKSTAEKGEIR